MVAATFDPDAVILDLHLPTLGGREVLRALRSNEQMRQVPVVACTAHAHLLRDDDAPPADFDALVTKPCDPEALRRIVDKLVGSDP